MGQPPPQEQVLSTEGKESGGPGQPQVRPWPPWVAGDSRARWGQDARVLGKGWIEPAVSTLHCSSLDSVFLSPIYTLSLFQGCPLRSEHRLTFSYSIWVLPPLGVLFDKSVFWPLTSLSPALCPPPFLLLSPLFFVSHFSTSWCAQPWISYLTLLSLRPFSGKMGQQSLLPPGL